jgi:hypothetical protein
MGGHEHHRARRISSEPMTDSYKSSIEIGIGVVPGTLFPRNK